MSLEFVNIQSIVAELAISHERMLAEQQKFNINAAKTLRLARFMYKFISGFEAFPAQLAEELRHSIKTEDYDNIQEICKQAVIIVKQLLKKDSGY